MDNLIAKSYCFDIFLSIILFSFLFVSAWTAEEGARHRMVPERMQYGASLVESTGL